MTDDTRIDTTLTLKHIHAALSVDCPLLALLAPEVYFAKRWDCGPNTFDFLMNFILDAKELDEEERKAAVQKVMDGKWELSYRDAPIQRNEQTPEDKLWPA